MTTHTNHKHGHRRRDEYDLYEDVEKIKAAMFGAAQNATGKASDVISDSIDNVKKQSTLLKKNVANYASEKPLQTLGIMLLTGIVIGYLLHK